MRTVVAGAGYLAGLLLAPMLLAEESPVPPSVRVAGEVRFKKSAPIFLRLIALDEAKKEVVVREQIIDLTAEDIARASIHFELAGLAPGRYALKCFQDTNGNKKIDIGMFGPKEPWSTYRLARPKFRPPRFEEMAFDAVQDVTNAHLILR
jgi:uncharacterized protein (DUF2141 family)